MSPTQYAKYVGVKIGEGTTVADKKHWGTEPYLITIGENSRITVGVKIFTHGGGDCT